MLLLLSPSRFCRIFLIFFAAAFGCKKSNNPPSTGNFPVDIYGIIHTNCAVEGCHTSHSKDAAAGLDLTSWSSLMSGGRNGQVVIPYNAGQSTLFLFTNTYEELGVSVFPTMPLNATRLSKTDIIRLRDWINNGSPNDQNEIAFAENSERLKYYVLNAVCDEISVIDANSGLVMRSFSPVVSTDPGFAEMIRVSADRRFMYALFSSGLFVKYDARNDEFLHEIQMPSGLWRSFALDDANEKAYLFEWSGNSQNQGARVMTVDLPQMTLSSIQPGNSFFFPLGGVVHPSQPQIYFSCFTGNFLYKLNTLTHSVDTILLDRDDDVQFSGSAYRPGMIKFFPDQTKYAVICEKSNQVRIFHAMSDNHIITLPTGQHPQGIAFSENQELMAITCMEDEEYDEGKGYVMILNTTDYSVLATINSGYQPRAIVADDFNHRFVVANRNADPTGADAPHHYTDCEGNNGYITCIDMFSLSLNEGYRLEVSVDPYSMDIR